MKIYNFDKDGVFTTESLADESPLEPGVFLIPANATDIAPPKTKDDENAVWDGSAWTLQSKPLPFDKTPEFVAMQEAAQAAAAKREAVLTALAAAAGLEVDELKVLLS